MFDTPPPNLPVEPPKPAPPTPPGGPLPLVPPRPAPMPPGVISTMPQKKEPEDILAGIEKPPLPKPSQEILFEPPKRSPLKTILVVLVVLIVLGAGGFAAWTFVIQPKLEEKPTPAPATTAPPVIEQPPVVEAPPSEVPAPTTTPPAGATIPVPVIPAPAAIGEGKDTDGDGLTDAEEPYYDADPANADTDGDTYSDGSEVRNLFDPSQKGKPLAAAKFISTLAWNGVALLAPRPWGIVSDPTNTEKMAVTTGSAARFSFERLANPSQDPLDAWLAKNGRAAPNVVKTKSGIEGRQSADGLLTYLSLGDTVLLVAYDVNGDLSYDLRTSYAMLVASIAAK